MAASQTYSVKICGFDNIIRQTIKSNLTKEEALLLHSQTLQKIKEIHSNPDLFFATKLKADPNYDFEDYVELGQCRIFKE